jgi:hypothetical protein
MDKVSVCNRGMNHGDHGCCGSGKLLKVKWWSSEGGAWRNKGSGDLEAVMVSCIFFVVIGQEWDENG